MDMHMTLPRNNHARSLASVHASLSLEDQYLLLSLPAIGQGHVLRLEQPGEGAA